MKRSIAIFFLFLILLNTAGYYVVLEGWKWHNSLTWAFDEDATQPELIVKIPFNIPYASENDGWEKADGQFEYQGETYRIVKQKLTLDAVYIALVKDQQGTLITEQQKNFAKTFSDKPVSSKQNSKTLPGFIKEYVPEKVSVEPFIAGWSLTAPGTETVDFLVPSYFASIVHPPERS